jgi:hypothetical protein
MRKLGEILIWNNKIGGGGWGRAVIPSIILHIYTSIILHIPSTILHIRKKCTCIRLSGLAGDFQCPSVYFLVEHELSSAIFPAETRSCLKLTSALYHSMIVVEEWICLPWIPEPSTVNNKLKRREGSGSTGRFFD